MSGDGVVVRRAGESDAPGTECQRIFGTGYPLWLNRSMELACFHEHGFAVIEGFLGVLTTDV